MWRVIVLDVAAMVCDSDSFPVVLIAISGGQGVRNLLLRMEVKWLLSCFAEAKLGRRLEQQTLSTVLHDKLALGLIPQRL